MNYTNEFYKRVIGDKYEFLVADIDDTNKATVRVVRSAAIKNATINVFFNASSYRKAKGVVHLLEHAVCGNVYQGMNMMQAKEVLKEKGVYFNAMTSYDFIGFHYMTDNISDSSIYKEDNIYQDFIRDKNFKAFSKIIAESFNGVINTPINEEYLNKERDIIYAEIQTRNPGDSYDITKIHMLNAITGGDFSAIGSKEYLENVTIDTLEALRHKVFRTDKVMEIKISVPEVVTDKEIKELVDNLMNSIYEAETCEAYYDVDKVDVDIIKAVMSDYVPDEINYSYATLDSHTPAINMKKEIYDFVTKPNATEMMKAIFVLPTCKISMEDNLKEFMYSHYAWLIIKLALNEFYRDKYPYLYRSSTFASTFSKDNTNYLIFSNIFDFEKDFDITKFDETLEEFKKEFLDTVLDKYLNILMIEKRNIWLGYMNLDFTEHDDVFHFIYPVSPSNFMTKITAEEYMKYLDGVIKDKDMAFPRRIVEECKENEALFNDIKEYTRYIFDKCQLVIFKVSEKQLKDEEIAKVMTEEKGE